MSLKKFFKNYWPALALIAIIFICVQLVSCATYQGLKNNAEDKLGQLENEIKKYDVEWCKRMSKKPDHCKKVDY